MLWHIILGFLTTWPTWSLEGASDFLYFTETNTKEELTPPSLQGDTVYIATQQHIATVPFQSTYFSKLCFPTIANMAAV